jgi:hypothetical protein
VIQDGDTHLVHGVDATGQRHRERFDTASAAVKHVAREHDGGLRFHDLRRSYATSDQHELDHLSKCHRATMIRGLSALDQSAAVDDGAGEGE